MKTLDRLRQNRHTPLILLLVGAALLLLTGLGQRELWGAETRWALSARAGAATHNSLNPHGRAAGQQIVSIL